MEKMACNNCGYTLKLNDLHERSLSAPEDGEFYVLCASCAGEEKPNSKNSEKTWIVEC